MYDVLIERSVRPGKGRHPSGYPTAAGSSPLDRRWLLCGNLPDWLPQPVPPQKARFVERLEQSGLAVTTQEEGGLALYRLLSGSIICPQAESEGQFSEAGGDGRIWRWIQYAGLRLTASELIRLEEQGTDPTPNLLGKRGGSY